MIALTWSGGSRLALFLIGGDVVLGVVLHLWPTTPLATFSGEHEHGKLRWLRVYPVILLMLVEREGGVS
jgi:hypothetical protein